MQCLPEVLPAVNKAWWAAIERIVSFARTTLELVGLAALAAGLCLYLFRERLLYNPSVETESVYKAYVVPVIRQGDEFNEINLEALKKNDPEIFRKLIVEFVGKRNLGASIQATVRFFDDLIECHESLFCRIDNYGQFEEPILDFWYTFSPVILDSRGAAEPADFGKAIQGEAGRILTEYREDGRIHPLGDNVRR
ncbi:MAG: hypothetical protein JO366_05675 [Methylobacteriaceae bacterium]|nr:hypothetical protein [Methylobacteriaceae bacterium]MBV9244283.1 hypothetical protein [Methylobacteriaceae bacterium]